MLEINGIGPKTLQLFKAQAFGIINRQETEMATKQPESSLPRIGPDDVTIDETGKVIMINPSLISSLTKLAAGDIARGGSAAADTNYGCGNNYKCETLESQFPPELEITPNEWLDAITRAGRPAAGE